MATEIKGSNNNFSEESNLSLEQLTVKSDMLLPNQKAIIKVLSGNCDINTVPVVQGDLVEIQGDASIALRTRFEETVDLNVQIIEV